MIHIARTGNFPTLLGEPTLAPLTALFVPRHDILPLRFPTPLAPRDHQSSVYVEGMPAEMIRLHTCRTYTPILVFPLADHFLRSTLMRRIDVMRDLSLTVK